MYWSRVKTILIFLFFALDIFLFGYIMYSDYDENAVSRTEKENTAAVLKNNNIKIDTEIIPDKTGWLGIVELNSIWTDSDSLAKSVLGTGAEKISDGAYSKGKTRLDLFEDGFSYSTGVKNITKPNAKTAAEELEQINISVDEKSGTAHGNELLFTQEIDGVPIFETGISVKASKDKLAEVYGYWIFSDSGDSIVKKQEARLMPATSVLINFIGSDLYDSHGDEITKIEEGYSIGSPAPDTQHKLVSVAPAYKITLKSGAYAVYDAINGEFLYEKGSD